MSLTAWIGTVAAICTTVAFIPQVVKVRRQGGEDLSYPMLGLYITGILLWLMYGIRMHAPAVIWANVVTAVLVAVTIALKATSKGKLSGKKRLRIAVDMDEVIADAFSEHLRRYNHQTGAGLTVQTILEKGLKPSIPAEHREIYNRIPYADDFFADLAVIEGSQEALAYLCQHHDVFITSAAMEVPTSFDAKFKWMERHFPFIPPSRIVFCGDKNIVRADVLIDDRARHFKGFAGTGILFSAPHNAKEEAALRANSWAEVLQILAKTPVAKPDNRPPRMLSMSPAES
jgi:5'(3')-deoxyribonucleotidase/uncharacterized protein with PQ loop repeat